jgi:hypothetical protein
MKPALLTVKVLGIVAAVVAVWLLLVDTVPPQSLHHVHMHMMKRCILRYASAHDALPTSVDQLPRIEGFTNEVTDGWGRAIFWRVEGNEVTLISYGRDGAPGGSGEDADMIGVFNTKTPDGRWADEFCEWRVDPYGRGK